MPAGVSAYVPLANVTLSSSAASVTFSSISQAYRDLVLVVSGVTLALGAGEFWLRFNNDTGSNYNFVRMSGNGSTASSQAASASGAYIGIFARPDTTVGFQSISQIFDYSATDKHKSVLTRADRATMGTDAIANRWANTAAITSITIQEPNNQNMGAGSTFALYGVSA